MLGDWYDHVSSYFVPRMRVSWTASILDCSIHEPDWRQFGH